MSTGEDWRLQTYVLNLKEDRETYLVDPKFGPTLHGNYCQLYFSPAINRQGVLFLWPVKFPSGDGRHDHWSKRPRGRGDGRIGWVRIVANMSLGAYEVYRANGDIPGTRWPDYSFEQIIEIAFKDNFIRDLDHAVIQRLRGLR